MVNYTIKRISGLRIVCKKNIKKNKKLQPQTEVYNKITYRTENPRMKHKKRVSAIIKN